MKHFYLTALAAGFCVIAFAADDWKTYLKNNQTEILYKYSDCHDNVNGIHQEKILLKIINLQDVKTEVSFSKELTYGSFKPALGDIKTYSVQLQPHEAKEGGCSEKSGALVIFSKQLNFNSTRLEKFELKDISVKTIQ